MIYNLNTKIDENEDFVSGLRAIHEAENRRILDDSAAQLKRCEEGFVRERETSQKQLEKLRKVLEDTRGERDSLYEKQVLRVNIVGQFQLMPHFNYGLSYALATT